MNMDRLPCYNALGVSPRHPPPEFSDAGSAEETMDDAHSNTKSANDRDRIRQLNDALRRSFAGGRIVMTAGVNALPDAEKAAVLTKVRLFDDFNGDNDPYGEHDFGSFEVAGETYFFKVDYYSPDLQAGSEHPADPERTIRVLTIMRADEY